METCHVLAVWFFFSLVLSAVRFVSQEDVIDVTFHSMLCIIISYQARSGAWVGLW